MKLINYTNPRLLIADEDKKIRDKNDVYKPAKYDTEGNVVEEEYFPYYTTVIFPAEQLDTLEKCEELYVEEDS
jgi:hypothetical protein